MSAAETETSALWSSMSCTAYVCCAAPAGHDLIIPQWHPTTAEKDIAWTEGIFKNAIKDTGKPLEDLTLNDFLPAVIKTFRSVDPNPCTRTFAGLKRGPDGRFDDDALAGVLHDAIEKGAGSYRARGTPAVLRLVEVMGMEQARQWGVCTMNEFRSFLQLKRFETFEEWNSDPEIAVSACSGYDSAASCSCS